MRFFDTHAHIGLIVEDTIERLIILKSAKHAKVDAIMSICNNLVDFKKLYKELSDSSNLFFAAGISPTEIEHKSRDWQEQLEEILTWNKVVAVGETGLDYMKKTGSRDQQIELFIKHLQLADRSNKPAIIHNRDANDDILDVLGSYMPKQGAVLHCFCEDPAFAQEAISRFDNLYISFAGNLTWRNSYNLHKSAILLPLNRILVETESPFMKPTMYKDVRTKPEFIHTTVEYLAGLRNESVEYVAETLFENAERFFQVSIPK
ncbi:TatD family hydrolase [Entomospira entomophila]|uniref:TatD family hydrolase n=1 Tax=Entomospira entomophila TaxID=2719988 RepID=A0A968KWC8_9SPIO|nr:TatD family hydrolase [Entomospira entomophilus]NIZ40695.1 TatD family hydrolase [Entomospira entomophilus]WDI34908.1 TatD family hydrolase [Entomospira entomophilus]